MDEWITAVLQLGFVVVGAFITYWLIRSAVFRGMKDFEKWKRDQNAGLDK